MSVATKVASEASGFSIKLNANRKKIAFVVGCVFLGITIYLISQAYKGKLRTFSMPMWGLFLALLFPLSVMAFRDYKRRERDEGSKNESTQPEQSEKKSAQSEQPDCSKQVSRVYLSSMLVLLILAIIHGSLPQYRHLMVDIPYEFLTIIPAVGMFAIVFPDDIIRNYSSRLTLKKPRSQKNT